jgi:hypothetical protein
MSNQEIEIKQKPVMKYKEYEIIVQKELDEYYEMMNEFRKKYIDFKEAEKYLNVEPMSYIDYCNFNGYDTEFKEDELKDFF